MDERVIRHLGRFFADYAAAYEPTYLENTPETSTAWRVDEDYRTALYERSAGRQELGLTTAETTVRRGSDGRSRSARPRAVGGGGPGAWRSFPSARGAAQQQEIVRSGP